jgi:hypothetical protein
LDGFATTGRRRRRAISGGGEELGLRHRRRLEAWRLGHGCSGRASRGRRRLIKAWGGPLACGPRTGRRAPVGLGRRRGLGRDLVRHGAAGGMTRVPLPSAAQGAGAGKRAGGRGPAELGQVGREAVLGRCTGGSGRAGWRAHGCWAGWLLRAAARPVG